MVSLSFLLSTHNALFGVGFLQVFNPVGKWRIAGATQNIYKCLGAMFDMIVTITGMPGSGKTTIGRALARKLGCKFLSIGTLRGEMAQQRGMTIDELNRLGEQQRWTDEEVDTLQQRLGMLNSDLVVDGWVSYHFIPHSFKVWLDVDPDEAARRVYADQRPDEPHHERVEDVGRMLTQRFEHSVKRYRHHYGIELTPDEGFDLRLDTTHLAPDQAVERIVEALGPKIQRNP